MPELAPFKTVLFNRRDPDAMWDDGCYSDGGDWMPGPYDLRWTDTKSATHGPIRQDPVVVARRKRPQRVCDCGRPTRRECLVPWTGYTPWKLTSLLTHERSLPPVARMPWVREEGESWLPVCRGCALGSGWPQR